MDEASKRFHNSTFDNIPADKRQLILKVVTEQLANEGLASARMKDIAKLAGVSYGSMYNYFPTRDDMIRVVIQEGKKLQASIFSEISHQNGSFFTDLQQVIERILLMAKQQTALIAVWVEISHAYNQRFAEDIHELEAEGIQFWKNRLTLAMRNQEIRDDVNINGIALLLDSTISTLLTSRISKVQEDRLQLLFDIDPSSDTEVSDEQLAYSLIDTAKRLLSK